MMLKPLDQKMADSERVKVVVRVRPLNEKESESHENSVVEVDFVRNELSVKKVASTTSIFGTSSSESEFKPFTYDGVFDNSFQQKQIYDNVFHSLVDSVLQGFNGTIFAYGQTGTGKTFTMEGTWESEKLYGVMPNSFKHIFDHISENPSQRYLIRASYLEIYQEEVRDLLSNRKLQKCEIREGPNGVYIKDLSNYLCSNFKEIAELMTKGNKNRAVGATNMNEHSSRSHAIFQITVETSEQWDEDGEHIKVGKLNLVDLAGSERASKTGAQGERFKEATKINLSLSSLGNVISALVDGASYIPYRDSKLTRLLQDSLGGNSRTVMVATVGPAACNYDETMNTLRYASRAKNIKNKPRINENPKDAVLRHYQEEINRLRSLVDEKKAQRRLPATENSFYKKSVDMKQICESTGDYLPREMSIGQNPIELMKESRVQQLTKLLEPYGIKFEGDLYEIMNQLQDRKTSLMKNTQMVKADKEKLLNKLQHATNEIQSAETECSSLVDQIEWLESKVLNSTGKQNLMQKMQRQTKEIELKNKELEDQKFKQEELRKALVEKQMTFEETLSTLNNTEEEFSTRLEKIAKMSRKAKVLQKEKNKIKKQHRKNSIKVEGCVKEISRELKLKKAIIDNFIPRKVLKDVEKRIRYDDGEDTYFIKPSVKTPMEPIPVDRMVQFPLFNKTRFRKLAPKTDLFFSNQNHLLLQPTFPKWKAKPYVADRINPKMEILLKEAMKDILKTLVVNGDLRIKRKTGKSETPIYTAVGPDILLRKIRSEKFIDFACVPSGISLPCGSNISMIQIPSIANNLRKFTHEELLALPLITLSGEIIFEEKTKQSIQLGNRSGPMKSILGSTFGNYDESMQQLSYNRNMLDPGLIQRNNNDYCRSHQTPHAIQPAAPCHKSMRQQETEWISKASIDFEIEQINRELMEDNLRYNLSTNLANDSSRIQLSCFEDEYVDKKLKTRPKTSRPESRKGHTSQLTNRNKREQSKDLQLKTEKQSMENEIIRRLKMVGLRSPPESEGSWSLGDYISADAERSPDVKIEMGKPEVTIPIPSKTCKSVPARQKSWLTQSLETKEPVNIDTRVVPRPKTARKIKTSSESLCLPSQARLTTAPLTSDKQRSLWARDLTKAVDQTGRIDTSVRRFPTFQTANSIGMTTARTEDNFDESDDDESWEDTTVEVAEKDLLESDLTNSSDEDNSMHTGNYQSNNSGYELKDKTAASNLTEDFSPGWKTEYSVRPPTRPSSQRRVNH